MGKMASFVLTKDKVFWSKKTDSHGEIIREFNLNADGTHGPNILRVEIIPPANNYSLPLDQWVYHVDQDTLPKWADKKDDEKRSRLLLTEWAALKIVRGKNEERRDCNCIALPNSSVEARGNSSVEAWENSSVEARDDSSVEAWENSSVVAWENSSVEAWENSSVEAWENSSVVARENSSVEAWENSSVVARDDSSVKAWGNSSVEAWENSSVVARENSSVEAWGNSSVEARGNSIIKSLQDKAIVQDWRQYPKMQIIVADKSIKLVQFKPTKPNEKLRVP
jgi:hypothetical protein